MMFNDITDYIALAGLIIIAIPFVFGGGFIVAAFLAALWLMVVKGIPFMLDILRERQSGVGAAKKKARVGGDGRRWNR